MGQYINGLLLKVKQIKSIRRTISYEVFVLRSIDEQHSLEVHENFHCELPRPLNIDESLKYKVNDNNVVMTRSTFFLVLFVPALSIEM